MLNEDECYQHLRNQIRTGTLMPNERLVEMDLSKGLGAGRAAVRTALARLEQEGLVERQRHRGARVRLISEAEAIEILEVRSALEPIIAYHAAVNASKADIAVLSSVLDDMESFHNANDWIRYSDGNARLHQTLIRIARHNTATRILDTLHSQSVRFQYRMMLSRGRIENSLAEHRAIVRAVSDGKPEEAKQAMREHLSRVVITLRELFKRST
ncbi:GntR family transcriptional regulator [Alicyclobacillus dauci]|uniref:GntR family transcriptional regulator n=1 Tax=Alicyclobacillus dauci TaxID=1475485 RepID=A0ABY6YYP8_9BACL|nr:GntR family transcriptional regulator [Alicyclobacillus dauci]WAH35701.1 GntR family transcriptional regulator [Alicyclobacillus dauci]